MLNEERSRLDQMASNSRDEATLEKVDTLADQLTSIVCIIPKLLQAIMPAAAVEEFKHVLENAHLDMRREAKADEDDVPLGDTWKAAEEA